MITHLSENRRDFWAFAVKINNTLFVYITVMCIFITIILFIHFFPNFSKRNRVIITLYYCFGCIVAINESYPERSNRICKISFSNYL